MPSESSDRRIDGPMSWWTKRKERKARARRLAADPRLRQVLEPHASSTCVFLHADSGILDNHTASGNVTWHLDGGTTVFIPKDEWYEICARIHKVFQASPDYDDVAKVA